MVSVTLFIWNCNLACLYTTHYTLQLQQ